MSYCLSCLCLLSDNQGFYDYLSGKQLCSKCRNYFKLVKHYNYNLGFKLLILYEYHDEIESLWYQYKENRDIALSQILVPDLKFFDKYHDYKIVFAPSDQNKLAYRGFHPLKEIFKECKLEVVDLFEKEGIMKSKTLKERLELSSNIKLIVKEIPEKLILIDDILVSGLTLKKCYDLLVGKTSYLETIVLYGSKNWLEK